jgi:hypothetical protein
MTNRLPAISPRDERGHAASLHSSGLPRRAFAGIRGGDAPSCAMPRTGLDGRRRPVAEARAGPGEKRPEARSRSFAEIIGHETCSNWGRRRKHVPSKPVSRLVRAPTDPRASCEVVLPVI